MKRGGVQHALAWYHQAETRQLGQHESRGVSTRVGTWYMLQAVLYADHTKDARRQRSSLTRCRQGMGHARPSLLEGASKGA